MMAMMPHKKQVFSALVELHLQFIALAILFNSQQELASNIQHIEMRMFPQLSLTFQGYQQIVIYLEEHASELIHLVKASVYRHRVNSVNNNSAILCSPEFII